MSNLPTVSVQLYPSSLNQLVALSARFKAPLQEVLHDVIINGVSQTAEAYEARSRGVTNRPSCNYVPRPNGMDYQ